MQVSELQFATIYKTRGPVGDSIMFRFADLSKNKFLLFAGVQTVELKSIDHLEQIQSESLFNILIRYHNRILEHALENYNRPGIELSEDGAKMRDYLIERMIDPEITIYFPSLKYPASFVMPPHKVSSSAED